MPIFSCNCTTLLSCNRNTYIISTNRPIILSCNSDVAVIISSVLVSKLKKLQDSPKQLNRELESLSAFSNYEIIFCLLFFIFISDIIQDSRVLF